MFPLKNLARKGLKLSSKQCRESHPNDKMVSQRGIPYIERPSLYQDGAQIKRDNNNNNTR